MRIDLLKDDTINVLHSICQQIWKTKQWPQDKKGQSSMDMSLSKLRKIVKDREAGHDPVHRVAKS